MAHSSCKVPLWDSSNTEDKNIVKFCPQHKDLLNNERVKLRDTVDLADLWSYLIQRHVLGKSERNRMEVNSTREEQVEKLLDHLERGPCWRLHAFLKACKDTSNDHIITLIGLDPKVYSDDASPSKSTHASGIQMLDGKIQAETAIKKSVTLLKRNYRITETLHEGHGLRMHSESYRRRLLRGNLFGFKHSTSYDTFPITECYIEQDLKLQRGARISRKDILKCTDGTRPQTVLISGSPGAGKTTFLEAIAHQWSEEHANFMKNPEKNAKPEQTIIVFAPATDLKGNVWASIERYVCCNDEAERKQISQHLKNDQSSAVLLDALDEIRDPRILSNIKEFIKDNHIYGGPQILVSARTGLSQLETEIFDRCLQLEGFTPEQGLTYIESFIGNHLKPPSSSNISSAMHRVEGSTAEERRPFQPGEIHSYMLHHRGEMNAILRNPLRVHITCGLAVEGVLKLDKDNTLKPLYLQKCLEEFILKRETRGNVVPPKDRLDFYRLCLYGLLKGIRIFTPKNLASFNVPPGSPYMAFFNTSQRIDECANNTIYYSFVHETFYEYYAVRCFEELPDGHKKAIILSVCAKDVLKNVRKMICQVLSQYETENTLTLALGMIRTMLLVKQGINGQNQDPLKLLPDIQENLPEIVDLLLHRNIDDKSLESKINCLWENIESQFTKPSDRLAYYWGDVLSSHSGMEYAADCSKYFSQEQWIYIMENSIYQLLPQEISLDDNCRCIYPTSNMRWAVLEWLQETVKVRGLHLSDCVEVLQQHTSRPQVPVEQTRYPIIKVIVNYMLSDHKLEKDAMRPSDFVPLFSTVKVTYTHVQNITFEEPKDYGCCIRLLDHLVTLSGNIPDIVVHKGGISLNDLHRWWCEAGHRYQGRVRLENPQLLLDKCTETEIDELVQWVEEAISKDVAQAIREDVPEWDGTVHLGDQITIHSLKLPAYLLCIFKKPHIGQLFALLFEKGII